MSDFNYNYIYHYSPKLFDQIESLAKQKNIPEEKLDKDAEVSVDEYCNPEVYERNISFFIDPIPLREISAIFNHKNKNWVSGKELYMYTVDVESLPIDIHYYVTETPLATKMLIDSDKYWPTDEKSKEYDNYLKKFKCKKLKLLTENKSIGYGRDNLIEQIKKYQGQTTEFFKKAQEITQLKDDVQSKYAVAVPHLMLYPKSGVINYLTVKKVKIL